MKTRKNSRKVRPLLLIVLLVISIVHILLTLSLRARLSEEVAKTEKIVSDNLAIDRAIILKNQPIYITLPGAIPIKAIKEDYTKPNSLWFYVNKEISIESTYIPTELVVPDLKSAGSLSVRKDTVELLTKMFNQAEKDGVFLKIVSAYRSYAYQTNLFNSLANSVGVEEANKSTALPGHSEHQLGLAVDLDSVAGSCTIGACFADTKEGSWLADNSYKFGFTLRYPKNKENITGYDYEPWHFRFLGVDLSTALHESKLTLDEAQPYITKALITLKTNQVKLSN